MEAAEEPPAPVSSGWYPQGGVLRVVLKKDLRFNTSPLTTSPYPPQHHPHPFKHATLSTEDFNRTVPE